MKNFINYKLNNMTKSKEAFNGEIPMKIKDTFSLGKKCESCGASVPDKPSNKKYCNNTCRDDYHNNLKKENQQELEKLKLQTDIQNQRNLFQDSVNQSEEVKKKKAVMQIWLKGLKVPNEGLIVSVDYINEVDFDINLYDNLITSKTHPNKYIPEYGDFGLFWIDVYKIMITNKQNYLLWEL